MVRIVSSEQQLPRRRGGLRKDKEIMKAQIVEEQHVELIAKELLKRAIQLEPVVKSKHEDRSRATRASVTGTNEEVPS